MSAKKVIVVLGSPRKGGNSATLADEVITGIEAAGGKVEQFFLHGMHIAPCSGCEACQELTAKNCVIQDDMQTLYPKLREADAIVIASPVYWFTVSAQTKTFMDRCYALGGPQGHALKGKRLGIVLAYADADPFKSGAVNAIRMFQDSCAYIGATLAGTVYGSASQPGEIKNNSAVMSEAYALGMKVVS